MKLIRGRQSLLQGRRQHRDSDRLCASGLRKDGAPGSGDIYLMDVRTKPSRV
jgi:hypothetical protein